MVQPNIVTHINAIDPASPAEQQQAIIQANTTAIHLSNHALNVSRSGDHRAAVDLYLQVLQMKIAAYSLQSVQAGITLNALGENYLALGELDEAEAVLKMAREAREAEPGNEFDAAVTRENLGRVYERKGDWEAARRVRAEGGKFVTCSNYSCTRETDEYTKMKRCASCSAPVYCGVACQKADWKERHKVLCQARAAAAPVAAS